MKKWDVLINVIIFVLGLITPLLIFNDAPWLYVENINGNSVFTAEELKSIVVYTKQAGLFPVDSVAAELHDSIGKEYPLSEQFPRVGNIHTFPVYLQKGDYTLTVTAKNFNKESQPIITLFKVVDKPRAYFDFGDWANKKDVNKKLLLSGEKTIFWKDSYRKARIYIAGSYSSIPIENVSIEFDLNGRVIALEEYEPVNQYCKVITNNITVNPGRSTSDWYTVSPIDIASITEETTIFGGDYKVIIYCPYLPTGSHVSFSVYYDTAASQQMYMYAYNAKPGTKQGSYYWRKGSELVREGIQFSDAVGFGDE